MLRLYLVVLGCCLPVIFGNASEAAFIMSVPAADLQTDGPGPHSVRIRITHNGVGPSTLSGYTVRFGLPSNASLGALPSGVTATSAIEILPVSSQAALFSLNLGTNTVAATGLVGNQDIGNGGTADLFQLNLNLGNAPSYSIGIDFQNAQRGGSLATQIGSEFFQSNSPTTDLIFVLTAVPEPNAFLLTAVSLSLASASGRRRRFMLG